MPGNSQRRNRRAASKKQRAVGSGGQRRKSLKGKGRTLPAEERPWHKAYTGDDVPKRTAWKQEKERRKAEAEGRPLPQRRSPAPSRRAAAPGETPELLVGRNPVVEALRAHVPATALYVAQRIELDDRVREALRLAGNRSIAILEVSRAELDRLTGGVLHQGLALQVPPFAYELFEDVLAGSLESAGTAPLLVALDGVTDPRNLGAIVRSAAAFGAHGVFLPERRAAGMTAVAWRASAGAAARMPIARVTNLTRALKACQAEGFIVVGLDADGEVSLYDLEVAVDPLVIVVGSEGRGLSRLVGETCDIRAAIPMASTVESLNASVAGAVALAEVARRRAGSTLAAGPPPAMPDAHRQ